MTALGTTGNLGSLGTNQGPGSAVNPAITQALMGLPGGSTGGGSGLFNAPLNVSLSGTQDDWAPTGWVPGSFNVLNITPTATPTINGIKTAGMTAGFTFLIYNTSTTGSINLANLASTSLAVNQIACPNAVAGVLQPQSGAILLFNGTNLVVAG